MTGPICKAGVTMGSQINPEPLKNWDDIFCLLICALEALAHFCTFLEMKALAVFIG
jgi:hypothetical protein